MQLAKNVIDIGLSTNNLEPMLQFWQQDVGIRFDHVLPVRRGQKQYRHDEQGSVIKINHHAEPLPEAAPSGYRELMSQGLALRHHSGWSIPTATAFNWCHRDTTASPRSPSPWASAA